MLRVCIGTEPRTEIARKVLEFSIRANLGPGREVEFHALSGGDWTGTGPLNQYTGFSLLRWTIPERFDHAGKAIYLDADQLVLADLGELWDADAGAPDGACMWCTYYEHRPRRRWFPLVRERRVLAESSVMLLDCAAARGRLRSFETIERTLTATPTQEAYDEVMHATYLDPPPVEVSPWWNVMDGRGRSGARFVDPRAKLLHYTRVPDQPWYHPGHPAGRIWERYLAQAIDDDAVHRDEIAAACARFSTSSGRPDGMHPYWLRYAR